MSEHSKKIKDYTCPACFAKELDVCLMRYDAGKEEYYCTKCAYAGTEADIKSFLSEYQKQRYRLMDREHPFQRAGKRPKTEWPAETAHAKRIRASLNGEALEVLETDSSYFIPAVYAGRAALRLQFAEETGEMRISPARLRMRADRIGDAYVLELDGPQHLYLDIEGLEKPILWHGNPEKKKEERATYYYKAGACYSVGTLVLRSGESVYIEEGAVVRGRIQSEKYAENITIGGYGILDAGCVMDNDSRTILMDCCKNVQIEDITILHTPSWHMMLAGCDGVTVRNVKEIGEVCGSDGVDIVGSRNVLVEQCMFRNNDDCVAIKAFQGGYCDGKGELIGGEAPRGWNQNVEHICVRNCIFLNEMCGNGIEIGHELQIEEVRDIVFQNIDLVRSEGYGAAISIHAGDRATVHDVRFEDIRIENYSDFLFDFRVMKSRFNHDAERGHIRDIFLKNIFVHHTANHQGYTMSVIGGWDEAHKAERIVFEDVYLGAQKLEHADMLELYQRHTDQIVFR